MISIFSVIKVAKQLLDTLTNYSRMKDNNVVKGITSQSSSSDSEGIICIK